MKKIHRITIGLIIAMFCLNSFNINSQDYSFVSQGVKRSYLVRLPHNYSENSQFPLVIVLHGGGWTFNDAENCYGFTKHADTTGYIVTYPQGLGGAWTRKNDVLFISSLIDTLAANFKIDKQRIYVTGHSAGGGLVYNLACDLSHKIAAFAGISGFMSNDNATFYKPIMPVPILIIHGTGDQVIEYNGRRGELISVDSLLNFWKMHNHVQILKDSLIMPNINTTDGSSVVKYRFGEAASEIIFYKVINGGHDVPNWCLNNEMGNTNRDINTPAVLWDFFKTHKSGGAKVTYIENAGFIIESDHKKVLIDALGIDPIPSVSIREKIINGTAPFNSVDLFLITHDHADHFYASFVSQQLINNPSAILIATKNIETQLSLQPDYNSFRSRVIAITPAWNKQIDTSANGIPVKIMRMHHDVDNSIENNGYLFELDNQKMLHIGDYTGNVLSELNTFDLKHKNIDIAFINYYCYLDNPNIWKAVREGIIAKYKIFYHIDTNDLTRMTNASKTMKNTTVFRNSLESEVFLANPGFFKNKAPVLSNSIPDTSARVGQNFYFKIANDSFTDDYNDFLFYSAKLIDGSELPDWLKFNANTRYFIGTPSQEEILSIKVISTDFAGAEVYDVFRLTVEQITGINNIKIKPEDTKIYPNPSSQTIQIRTSGSTTGFVDFKLMDLSGKTVKQGRLKSHTIDISNLGKGVYILNLKNIKGIISKKVVIE